MSFWIGMILVLICTAWEMYRDHKYSKTPEGKRWQDREDAGYNR